MGPCFRRDDGKFEPVFPTPRQRASAARGTVFMKIWLLAVAALVAAGPAFAADVAICTLSADKKTVTVTASNPYSQVMACEVNCHMAIPNGIATVVCVKPVPAGAKDFVMCNEAAGNGQVYTRVKGTSLNLPDPPTPAAEKGKAD